MIAAAFTFTGAGSTHAQQAAPPTPPPPPAQPTTLVPGGGHPTVPEPNTTPLPGRQPPLPGGGAAGAAARVAPVPPAGLAQPAGPAPGDSQWFFQLSGFMSPPQLTNSDYAYLIALPASNLPPYNPGGCCSGYGRESYFVQLAFDSSQAQAGFDDWPGNGLHVFIYDNSSTNGVTCLGSMQPAPGWKNPNGTYQGCEGTAFDLHVNFNTYYGFQIWDNAGQLQFYLGGTELGYYSDGTSPGINGQYYESEIGELNINESMQQLLSKGLKYYGYYPDLYWWNGSGWQQFTDPFTARQQTFYLPSGHADGGNPYCRTFGQSASDFYTNDYADMMENLSCPGNPQSIPPNP